MLTLTQNVLILIVVMAASLLFMEGLNRFWPVEERHTPNDLIGWQLSVLGTTYAVTLGFMLYTDWTNFNAAYLNSEMEANALRNIYRLAEGLPQQREQIENLVRSYADAVINRDWPDMARGRLPENSHEINEDMWKTLMAVKVTSPSEIMAEDHALTELSTLTLHRRTRLLQSTYELPTIFWCVLLVGGVLTIISVSMFGSANRRVHALQVVSLTLLVTLVMLAIADVDRPFRGWVRISNYSFQRAQQTMR
jgi:membrane-associated HD superfamily phosphohydrolase